MAGDNPFLEVAGNPEYYPILPLELNRFGVDAFGFLFNQMVDNLHSTHYIQLHG
jgi:hypothetical protein